MPLPDASIEWPPPALACESQRFADYDAWWSGNPDKLGKVYERRDSTAPKDRPSQYRGGVVGTLSRWFWGNPLPSSGRRTGIHIPLPADIATASADMLFARPPSFRFETPANTDAWENLDDQMRLDAVLHEAAEVCSPFGGVYLRTGFDRELWDHPIVSAVHADQAIPTFKWGRLVAVTFVRELGRDGSTVTRYLERYELTGAPQSRTVWAFHAVYVGSPDKLGRRVDLGAFEETQGLPDAVDLAMPVLPVAYAPNVKISREERGSDLGRSDFEGCLQLFDALDTTASSLLRDIRLGKARAFIPEAFLTNLGRGVGASWDPDNEIYSALDIPPTSGAAEINVQQFAIRVADHVAAMEHWAKTAVETAGYSAQTFGLGRDGEAATATEVTDRKDRSNGNRGKKTRYMGYALREMAEAILWTAKTQFDADVDPEDLPEIQWPAAPVDQVQQAQAIAALRTAGTISRYLAVKEQNPDWDEDEIKDELARIEGEQEVQDPGTFIGGPFEGSETTPEDEASRGDSPTPDEEREET